MAIKSIVDIEIQDDKFKNFASMYEKYQALLAKSPGHWAEAGKQVSVLQRGVSNISNTMGKQVEVFSSMTEEQAKSVVQVRTLDRLWHSVSSRTKEVAGNLKGAVSSAFNMGSLLKGAVIGAAGVVASLATGAFGLDKLASSVSSKRRSSLGLGLPYGAKEAFGATFGRVVDPDSFLSGIAEAKFDITKRAGLYNLGISQTDIENKDTAQLSIETLRRAKQFADKTPDGLLGTLSSRLGLDEKGLDAQTLKALKGTQWSEFDDLAKRSTDDRTKFAVSDEATKRYADLNTTMIEAGQTMETVLIKKVDSITPYFERLSKSVEQAAISFDHLNDHTYDKVDPKTVRPDQRGAYGEEPATAGNAKFNAWMHYFLGYEPGYDPGKDGSQLPANAKPRMYPPHSLGKGYNQLTGRLSASDLEAYIRKSAIEHHVDPDVAMAVAKHEGFKQFYSTIPGEDSVGAFQLHYTNDPKHPAVGDMFTKYTGLDAHDPRNETAGIDFAMARVNKYGWGDWMGAKAAGITGFYGVDKGTPTVNIWNHIGANVTSTANSVANWPGG